MQTGTQRATRLVVVWRFASRDRGAFMRKSSRRTSCGGSTEGVPLLDQCQVGGVAEAGLRGHTIAKGGEDKRRQLRKGFGRSWALPFPLRASGRLCLQPW